MTTTNGDGGARWITEALHKGFQCRYRADRLFLDEETHDQHLAIFDNPSYGRMMTLNGIAQVTERDEFVYHENMTHPAMFAHGDVRRVLVIGGGDGGMIKQVFKHRSVEHVTMVEIDAAVVETAKKFMPSISDGAFDDPRLELVIDDGAKFVRDSDQSFDLIIVDSTDPIGPAEVLFTDTFYGHCRQRLSPGGILINQAGLPFHQPDELKNVMAHFRALFPSAACYLATIPSYLGGYFCFCWGSDTPAHLDVPLETLRQRFKAAGFKTRYYTPDIHKAVFVLPPYIEDIIEGRWKPGDPAP